MTNAAKVTTIEHDEVAPQPIPQPTAAELRAKIFGNAKKPERREFTFNGIQLEFLQPAIGELYSANGSNSEGKSFIVKAMIDNAVAPGTTDKVFNDADYDGIMEMPMSGDMASVAKIVTELFNIDVGEKAKN